ncbi:MAG: hypothetical protein QW756_08785 [Nitrososphaerota archaeon]
MRGAYLILLLAGTLARLALSPFFGHSWDVYVWLQSGGLAARGINVYEIRELTEFPWGFYSYPPLWLYWLTISSFIGQGLGLNAQIVIIKLPIIISDLLSAWLLHRLAKRYGLSEARASQLALLFFLNPITVLISSVWGMFDSIAVLFTLTSFYLLQLGKVKLSGLALAAGAATKIFPIFLIVPFIIYLRKSRFGTLRTVLSFVAGVSAGLLFSTTPYLPSLRGLLEKISFHLTNIGQFTYWVVVSNFIQADIIGPLSFLVFILLCFFTMRKAMNSGGSLDSILLNSVNGVLLAFLATSTKVNVQYTLWILPLLLLQLSMVKNREMTVNFLILNLLALLFVISGQVTLALFDLKNLGRITPQPENPFTSLAAFFIIASGVAAGTRFVALLLNHLQLAASSFWNPSRVAVIGLVIILTVSLSTFPSPKGVILPYSGLRVGVAEGVESFFSIEGDMGVPLLKSRFDITHVVIPLAPDAVNNLEGEDLARNTRFRLTTVPWYTGDLKALITQLHHHGLKALIGVFLKSYYYSVHFGYHGYNSTWLNGQHRQLTDHNGNIYFQYLVPDINRTYADFFAGNAIRLMDSVGADGIYLMGVDWDAGPEVFDSVSSLLKSLSRQARNYEVFLELDPYVLRKHTEVGELFELADYILIETNPWVRRVKGNIIGNYTVAEFKSLLEEAVSLSRTRRAKLLYGVYAIDVVEGWLTPAVDLQIQVDQYSSVPGVAGYVIHSINRYLPYRLTVEKPAPPYSS